MEQLKTILVPWHLKPFLCGVGVAAWAAALSVLWLLTSSPLVGVGSQIFVYALANVACFTWMILLAYEMDK